MADFDLGYMFAELTNLYTSGCRWADHLVDEMLLSLIYFYTTFAQQTLASLPGIYTLMAELIGSVVDDLTGDGPLGHLSGHLVGCWATYLFLYNVI
jgi:hypothetical protein